MHTDPQTIKNPGFDVQSLEMNFHPFAASFNVNNNSCQRLAVSSFETTISNELTILKSDGTKFSTEASYPLIFPQFELVFAGLANQESDDVLLSCGDTLKVWKVSPGSLSILSDIQINQTSDPVTCLDWSPFVPNLAICGSTDANASAIDLRAGTIVSRIVAHDHPVHDIAFCGSAAQFLTASFDGTLRFFDLRDLSSSLIYYQSAHPLMRIAVSPFDENLIATFSHGSHSVVIIDIRQPGVPYCICSHNTSRVTAVSWGELIENRLFTSDEAGVCYQTNISEGMNDAQAKSVYQCPGPVESLCIGRKVAAVASGKSMFFLAANEHYDLPPDTE